MTNPIVMPALIPMSVAINNLISMFIEQSPLLVWAFHSPCTDISYTLGPCHHQMFSINLRDNELRAHSFDTFPLIKTGTSSKDK